MYLFFVVKFKTWKCGALSNKNNTKGVAHAMQGMFLFSFSLLILNKKCLKHTLQLHYCERSDLLKSLLIKECVQNRGIYENVMFYLELCPTVKDVLSSKSNASFPN